MSFDVKFGRHAETKLVPTFVGDQPSCLRRILQTLEGRLKSHALTRILQLYDWRMIL